MTDYWKISVEKWHEDDPWLNTGVQRLIWEPLVRCLWEPNPLAGWHFMFLQESDLGLIQVTFPRGFQNRIRERNAFLLSFLVGAPHGVLFSKQPWFSEANGSPWWTIDRESQAFSQQEHEYIFDGSCSSTSLNRRHCHPALPSLTHYATENSAEKLQRETAVTEPAAGRGELPTLLNFDLSKPKKGSLTFFFPSYPKGKVHSTGPRRILSAEERGRNKQTKQRWHHLGSCHWKTGDKIPSRAKSNSAIQVFG